MYWIQILHKSSFVSVLGVVYEDVLRLNGVENLSVLK
jgi:hypothetical protein